MDNRMDSQPETPVPSSSRADAAGALLVVVAMAGGAAWIWRVLYTQVDNDPGSLSDRIDALVGLTPLLLLAVAVAGLGIGLRHLAALQTDRPATGTLGRPVGRIALGLVAALAMFVGVAAFAESRDEPQLVLGARGLDLDELLQIQTGRTEFLGTTPATAPTHTLEVHTDGCGVFRTGQLGERLTWVVKDQDGFQVLGRNAAGETQYRYYRSGAYTVVLEAWGAGHYVEVSNQVEITC